MTDQEILAKLDEIARGYSEGSDLYDLESLLVEILDEMDRRSDR